MSDEVSFNLQGLKKGFDKTKKFFARKDVQIILTVVVLLGILILGSWIRVQNLDLLKDQTTGEYIPLALDPHYFIRVAETIVDNGWSLPAEDIMRNPSRPTAFTQEILPWTIAGIYSIGNIFSDVTINFAGVISPVIFYIIGLFVFFFLCLKLTKSKLASVIASVFLAFIPSYLYRTLAGFADHEAVGMVAFFGALLAYAFSIGRLEKSKESKRNKYVPLLLGVLVGFLTTLTVASWGGLSNFVFMILPLSALIIWIVRIQGENKSSWKKYLMFYVSWLVFSVVLAPILGLEVGTVLGRVRTSTGLVSLFALVFMAIDSVLIKTKILDKKLKGNKDFKRIVYSVLISLGLGIVFLLAQGSFISVVGDLFVKILNPFSSAGGSRLGATVAENASPYLSDWISQTGKVFFWISVLGLGLFGFQFFEKVPKKSRNLGVALWILLIAGIFFSRYSSGSILNGDNFISKLFYFGSVVLFIWFVGKLYYKKELKISSENILIFSWMILMLIGARGAVRLLFVITPFFCFIAGWNFGFLLKKVKQKDELKKIIVILLIMGLVFASFVSISNFVKNSTYQAQNTGPSANYQWQEAMSWIRENTAEESIFVHWWDYGYWIQSLGERATVTDGGHAGGDNTDHYIGRYILTTPEPETALSFMKTHDVSYLLIDSTDLGKYSAYSRIGSDLEYDRFSYLPTGVKDGSQTQELNNKTINVYPISGGVDEDILYEDSEGNTIFLPGPSYDDAGNPSYKSYLGGIVLNTVSTDGNFYSEQPEAVYIYQGNQIRIPLRYAYMQGELIDFGRGLDAVFFMFPRISSSDQGISVDEFGAGIYLSPKVSKSLFAQLYLMNDPLDKYYSLSLAHSEDDFVTSSLRMQGADVGEFVYYQGFRGPIKMWEVSYSSDVEVHEEFLDSNFSYGGLDYLFE